MATNSQNIKAFIAFTLNSLGVIKLAKFVRLSIMKKPRVMVLCYHRIIEKGGLLSPQCVSPALFAKHLKYIDKNYHVLNMDELYKFKQGKLKLDKDAVFFTFDDGYMDNYQFAAAMLDEYQFKGVFYISSAVLLADQTYWIDRLSVYLSALLDNQNEAIRKAIPIEHNENEFHESVKKTFSIIVNHQEDKKATAKMVFNETMKLNEDERKFVLSKLNSICNENGLSLDDTPELMSSENVHDLLKRGHYLGGHTVSHPRLVNLSETQLQYQVSDSLKELRKEFGKITTFAYPFGKLSDIPEDRENIYNLLDENDIDLAFTTDDNMALVDDHNLLIPRKVISPQTTHQIAIKFEQMFWNRI